MKKIIYTLTAATLLLSSCAQHYVCPTYSNAGPKKHHHASHHPHYVAH